MQYQEQLRASQSLQSSQLHILPLNLMALNRLQSTADTTPSCPCIHVRAFPALPLLHTSELYSILSVQEISYTTQALCIT